MFEFTQLNGKNGLGENIADNGGAHVSFEAFKARHLRSPSARLAALPQYTPEQLFFLIWGTVSILLLLFLLLLFSCSLLYHDRLFACFTRAGAPKLDLSCRNC